MPREYCGNLSTCPAWRLVFYDMELCNFNLQQYIYEPDTLNGMLMLDMQMMLKIMKDVSRGLAFIHKNKKIHRDIKPQNSTPLLHFNNGSPIFTTEWSMENCRLQIFNRCRIRCFGEWIGERNTMLSSSRGVFIFDLQQLHWYWGSWMCVLWAHLRKTCIWRPLGG